MCGALQLLQQLCNIVIAQSCRKAHASRSHNKMLPSLVWGRGQPQAKEVVHSFLQRLAGMPHLPVEQAGDIVIERERCTHTLMLSI